MEPSSTLDEPATDDQPTNELSASLANTSTDRCPNCGTRMAVDQRYCINCGERRSGGGLRDAMPRTQPAAAAAPARRERPHLGSGATMIAGIATLLLAMGVGVLIGRSGDNGSSSKAATPQVVTVSAGTGAASNTASTAAAAAGTAAAVKHASKKHRSSASSKAAKVSGTSSVDATAKKNGVKLPPKVVKVGQKCAKGAKGCQGGKFTGNFFGGG